MKDDCGFLTIRVLTVWYDDEEMLTRRGSGKLLDGASKEGLWIKTYLIAKHVAAIQPLNSWLQKRLAKTVSMLQHRGREVRHTIGSTLLGQDLQDLLEYGTEIKIQQSILKGVSRWYKRMMRRKNIRLHP